MIASDGLYNHTARETTKGLADFHDVCSMAVKILSGCVRSSIHEFSHK